ncbi:hypothetical protein OQA88_3610 [Cercophora sp. LCS_1]
MDSSLHEVWQAASGRPFVPTIGKDSQFFYASLLVILGLGLSGAFALSMYRMRHQVAMYMAYQQSRPVSRQSPSARCPGITCPRVCPPSQGVCLALT